MARATELARAGFVGTWNVPLWHLAVQPVADLTQGATEVLIDTTVSDFRSGEQAGIAVDGKDAAPVAIASVQPDRLILAEPLGLQLPAMTVAARRITVVPIRAGILSSPVEITRRRQGDGTVTASFLLRDTPELASIRFVRRTAMQTAVRMITTGVMLALLAGIALKLRIFGSAP